MTNNNIDNMLKNPKCVVLSLTLLTMLIIKTIRKIQQTRNNKIR